MNSAKVKIPAKVNLTLDVLSKEDGYHNIRSLVSSVNIYDTITVKKRKDSEITLEVKGFDCKCSFEENNAYKAAKLYQDKYSTCGVDIKLKKAIPLASGLGGSSADIAGVLIAMNKMFKHNHEIFSLANEIGSDAGYMLSGGYSVLCERGNTLIPVRIKLKIPAIIITDDKIISAKEGYAGFDKAKKIYPSHTLEAVSEMINHYADFMKLLKNDLQPYAEKVLPELKDKLSDLKKSGAEASLMTGSGSAVYGLFFSKKARDIAYKTLKEKYANHIYKCHTF